MVNVLIDKNVIHITSEVLKNIPILLVGAFLGIVCDSYVKRPKLALVGNGGGGGPGPGFYRNNIQIQNEPGSFGMKMKPTIILGKSIHGYIEKGLVFDRIPAHECRAYITDKETGKYIHPLWWRSLNNPNTFTQTLTLNSGDKAELLLFARLYNERSKYFVYEPQSSSVDTPKVPDDEAKFSATREFVINIQYAYGKKTWKLPIKIIKGFDGSLSYEIKSSIGSL